MILPIAEWVCSEEGYNIQPATLPATPAGDRYDRLPIAEWVCSKESYNIGKGFIPWDKHGS